LIDDIHKADYKSISLSSSILAENNINERKEFEFILDELQHDESCLREEEMLNQQIKSINMVNTTKHTRFESTGGFLQDELFSPDSNSSNKAIDRVNTIQIDLKASIFNSVVTNDLASLYQPYNCSIYVFGGKCENTTRKYVLETSSWTTQKKLNINRCDFTALMYKDKRILIMGGKYTSQLGVENITDSIALINSQEENINELDFRLKYPRSNFGAVYVNYTIYVCGGFNGKEVLNNFEYFDKKNKKWIDMPKMPTRRREFSLIYGPDNSIYAIGGYDEKE
jgi:hypothetical protein